MNVQTFREDFPEFSSSDRYPDRVVNYWLGIGTKMLNANVWGNLLDNALELFTAHHIVLTALAIRESTKPGGVGFSKGPATSKTVDKVSVSYDASAALIKDAGHWNLTVYGVQFKQLADMFGAGGIQIGGSDIVEGYGSWAGFGFGGPGFFNS